MIKFVKFKFIQGIIVIMVFFLLIACTNGNITEQQDNMNDQVKTDDNNKINYKERNQELTKLLPQAEDYTWIYSGFAEYGHQMNLKGIANLDNKIIYLVRGEVDDLSDGEAKGNFGLEVIYVIEKGKLIQRKNGEKMMDSLFDELTLIEAPLKEGNVWHQKLKDDNGNNYNLKCSIENIKEINGKKIYTVMYQDLNSDYYEKRQIKEDVGIVSFERLYKQNNDSFTIGYSLYKRASGYKNYLEMNKFLPPLDKRLVFHGLAEYAHSGILRKISEDPSKSVYEFSGDFEDGSGLGGTFKVSYILNYQDGTIIEKVTENTRGNENRVNSILKNFIILKLPIETGNRWVQTLEIDGKKYNMEAKIIDISYKDQPYYPVEAIDTYKPVVKVRYVVKGIEEYFTDTYIEERIFEAGKGMISFSNLMKGDLPLSGKDLEDIYKVNRIISDHMFGYSLSFIE